MSSRGPAGSSRSRTTAPTGTRRSEAAGDPMEGLAPGTRWSDLPDTWICPMCGTPKADFDMIEL